MCPLIWCFPNILNKFMLIFTCDCAKKAAETTDEGQSLGLGRPSFRFCPWGITLPPVVFWPSLNFTCLFLKRECPQLTGVWLDWVRGVRQELKVLTATECRAQKCHLLHSVSCPDVETHHYPWRALQVEFANLTVGHNHSGELVSAGSLSPTPSDSDYLIWKRQESAFPSSSVIWIQGIRGMERVPLGHEEDTERLRDEQNPQWS